MFVDAMDCFVEVECWFFSNTRGVRELVFDDESLFSCFLRPCDIKFAHFQKKLGLYFVVMKYGEVFVMNSDNIKKLINPNNNNNL